MEKVKKTKWIWIIAGGGIFLLLAGTAIVLFVTAKLQQGMVNKEPGYSSRDLYSKSVEQIDKGDYEQAEKYLESALLITDDPSYRNQLAVVKYRLRKYSEAEEQYNKMLEAKKDEAFAWNGLGNVYRDWSENDQLKSDEYYLKAQDAYNNCMRADKNYIAAYSNMALMLNSHEKKEDALVILDQGILVSKSVELQKVRNLLAK